MEALFVLIYFLPWIIYPFVFLYRNRFTYLYEGTSWPPIRPIVGLYIGLALVSGNGFAALPESIYIIAQGNDSIQRIDLDGETATTVKELDFYSQGEAVYDSIGGSLYLLNPSVSPKKVISYDLTAGTSDELSIANDDGPVLSLFGINSEANVFVLTDRFEDLGETYAEAKRFAKVDTEGALTRLGTTLPTGSIFPQGRQLYNELNNTVYTIANDQSKKLIAMNLADNSVESASTTASTLVGFTADGNIIGLVTGTDDPKILSINLETGEETTLVSGVPTGGYDNFARGYVDLANDRVVMMLGGQATDSFSGSGIATYSLSTGELIKAYETEGQGRFVVTSLLKKVDSGTEIFDDDIEASLAVLVKLGDGELVVTGDNASEGGIVVKEGLLSQNGTAEDSLAIIDNDGTLGGSGTVGGITSNGTVAPGNSIGTLNVSGDVTLNSGSVLVIEVDADGNNDKIIASGDVTAGGTLTISPESGSYNPTNNYTIITGSSINGTFSSINVLSCSGTATAEYGSSNIVVTLSNCDLNISSNQSSISNYISDLSLSGDLQSTINELNSLSGTDYNDAVQQLDTNNNSSITAANLGITNNINNIILLRSQLVQGTTPKDAKTANFLSDTKLQIENNLALGFANSANLMEGDGAWIKVHGSQGDRGDISDIGVNGFKNNYFATTIGFDDVRKDQVNGYSLTMANELTTFDRSEGSQSSSSYYLSSYQTSTLANSNQLTFIGTVGYKSNDTSRVINYGSIARTATGEFDNYLLDINAIVDVSRPNDSRHDISWSIGLMYDQQQGYTETGANSLNLSVDQSENYILKLGLYDNYLFDPIISASTTIQPLLSAGLRFNQYLQTPQSSQKFVNQSSSFTTQTNEKSEILGDISLGAIITTGENSKFNIGIQTTQSNLSQEYAATAQYNYSF